MASDALSAAGRLEEEDEVIRDLVRSFRESAKLQAHVDFLFDRGSVYLVHNGDLLFHGCVPMNDDGTLHMMDCAGRRDCIVCSVCCQRKAD